MDEKICDVEQFLDESVEFEYFRPTVRSLKKALENLDDDSFIGVRFDGGYGYTDVQSILLTDKGLYILDCD